MNVIGTELYDKGMDSAVEEFVDLLKQPPKNLLISPSDANVLVHARTNKEFKKIVDNYFWNLPDGMPSAWILKLKGAKNATRCSGPDFFKQIINETKDLPVNHYLCGGAPNVANQLKDTCKRWGNNNVVGTHCPPYKELSDQELQTIANDINEKQINVLWVGLGTPKQIYFSSRISKMTNVQFIIPIGAAFDFHTGKVKKSPIWIQNIGMEWVYRIYQEPKRLFKRYLKVVPQFIWYNLVSF